MHDLGKLAKCQNVVRCEITYVRLPIHCVGNMVIGTPPEFRCIMIFCKSTSNKEPGIFGYNIVSRGCAHAH